MPDPVRIVNRTPLNPWASVTAPRAAVLLLPLLLAAGGCMDQLPPVGPLSGIGVVEGRVREAGVGLPARVRFLRVSGGANDALDVDITIEADSTGWYRAELPLGMYRIRLSLRDNESNPIAAGDTIAVGRAVRRRDFERGRLRAAIRLPEQFDEPFYQLRLFNYDQSATQRGEQQGDATVFDVRLVPAGSYTMRLTLGYRHDPFYLPGTFLSDEADSLRMGNGDMALDIDLRPRHASVSGRVRGTWHDNGDGARVRLFTTSGRVFGEGDCNEDGTFRIDTLMPEPALLALDASAVRIWHGDGARANATVLDLAPGTHLEDADFVVGALRVTSDGPGPLVGSAPRLDLVRDDGLRIAIQASSGGNPLLLSSLPPGGYRLRVLGFCAEQPWQPQWYPGVADSALAGVIAVAAGEWAAVTLDLQPGGGIGGHLVFPSWTYEHYVDFDVHDAAGARLCSGSIEAFDGRFLVEGLPDGSYCLGLQRGSTRWWYPGTADLAEAGRVAVSGGAVVDGLTWLLPGATAGDMP